MAAKSSRFVRRFGIALAMMSGLVLFGAPAGAAGTAQEATVTVDPSTGLDDGDTVKVTFTGLEANSPVTIRECIFRVPINPKAGQACHATVHATTDSRGTGSASYTVTRTIHDGFSGRTYECPSTGTEPFKCRIGVFGPVRFDYAPIAFRN